MKIKFLALVVLLAFFSGMTCAQTPTFVYSNAAAAAVPAGTQWGFNGTCTSSNPCYRHAVDPNDITAGSTIVVSLGYDSTGSNQVFSVTDDKSNTYTSQVTSSAVSNRTLKIFSSVNVTGGVSYVQVQLTSGTQNGYWQPMVAVFYNVGAVDGTPACNTGTSATIQAGSLTGLTTTGDLVYQSKYSASITSTNLPAVQTASFTAGSQSNIAWSLASELLSDGAADQYGVYSSTANFTPQFTQAASDTYASCAVAFKAASSGSTPSQALRVLHQEHDAMPHNAANPFVLGAVVDLSNSAVYVSYVGNDALSTPFVTSSPAPDVGWTASGADFSGLNGHNHVNLYCAKWNSAPGTVAISLTRSGTTNDSVNMVYVVKGATCNLDVDSGGSNGNQGTAGNLTSCSSCLTPTASNDMVFVFGGQFACTATSLAAPAGGVFDSSWFNGNSEDGPTQTDENNYWMHLFNGNSLSAITVTWGESCDAPNGFWASRAAAYKSSGLSPPTGIKVVPKMRPAGFRWLRRVRPAREGD